MAGWDEEALLLVVEDTPERNLENKKRSDLSFKSPPSSNRSRRRRRRARPGLIPMAVINLDDEDDGTSNTNQEDEEKSKNEDLTKKVEETPKEKEKKSEKCSNSSTLAFMDRLREELSCAICLDICYEPSTTPCGHSFCKNCLKSAADRCGKRCPKCRQLIRNGRSCTVNTVLWNTIQLLFPQEVESRKAAIDAAWTSQVTDQRKKSPERMISSSNQGNIRDVLRRMLRVSRRSEDVNFRSAREVLNEDEVSSSNQGNTRDGLMRMPGVSRRSEDVNSRSAREVLNEDEDAEGNTRNTLMRMLGVSRRSEDVNLCSARVVLNEDDDAALALRLQREEFMEIYRGSSLARDNLRAMTQRALNFARNGAV